MTLRYTIAALMSGLLPFVASGQNLNFKTTAPAWAGNNTSNNYTQIGTPAVDVSVSIASVGVQTFTLGTPKGVSTGLQLAIDLPNTTDEKVITITFARSVIGLSFSIYGIDQTASAQDRVSVSGELNGTPVSPSLTPSAYVSVAGNTFTGSGDDPGSSASNIVFATHVSKVTIVFGSGASAPANPGAQGVTLGHLNWQGPLPVELISFTARPVGTQVQLDWATSWERNAESFSVQRSTDLGEFTTLATLPAAGTVEGRRTYRFVDAFPLDGTGYYRLRQVDFDGQTTYSKPVAASLTDRTPALVVLENPVAATGIRAAVRNLPDARYQLITPAGTELPLTAAQQPDASWLLTAAQPVPAGMYLLRADTGPQRLVQRLLIR